MRIVISVSESDAFEGLNAGNQVFSICRQVDSDRDELLLIPQPGSLMTLIKVLKDNNITYQIEDLPSHHSDTL